MSTSVLKRAAALATTAAFALALTACGGDSDKESTGTGSNPFGNKDNTAEATPSESPEPTETSEAPTEDPEPNNGDASDCDMIDGSTVASITGLPFESVEPEVEAMGGAQVSCTWNLEGDSIAVFQVVIADGDGADMALTRESLAAIFDDVTDVSVPGAEYAFSVMGGVLVGMAIDGDYVQVMFMDMYGEDTSAATLQLAGEVAANL